MTEWEEGKGQAEGKREGRKYERKREGKEKRRNRKKGSWEEKETPQDNELRKGLSRTSHEFTDPGTNKSEKFQIWGTLDHVSAALPT